MNEHEQAFVHSFIRREKRKRYLLLMSTPKRRSEFRDRLSHALEADLDPRYCLRQESLPKAIAAEVGRLQNSASNCHILADDDELDGQVMSSAEAEFKWNHLGAIVVSVVPGVLAFYRPERPGDNFVLFKQDC